jgi:hypothetical protein
MRSEVKEDPNGVSQVPSSIPLEWRPGSPYIESRVRLHMERGVISTEWS